jgi:hypothetical protein
MTEDLQMQNEELAYNNLEHDLKTTDWLVEKVTTDKSYAADLYSALCNNEYRKNEVWPILQDKSWSCSWRYAGTIIADIKEEGTYLDWYGGGKEGNITEEVKNDLAKLSWMVLSPDDEDE